MGRVMELFNRTKTFSVDWQEKAGLFVVRVDMLDAYHDMGVEVDIEYPALLLRAVRPRMDKTPYPVCPESLKRAQACVGMKIETGLHFRLQRAVGGVEGCSHITQLLADACSAAVQGLLAIESQGEDGRSRRIPAAKKIEVLEKYRLPIRDTCRAYAGEDKES